ncbi:outer membrane protein [Anaeromyxobacter oryzisoli]|uniref:outer membrane protein n=1 Tax=Anaeromyxobacter oryzisoli TaxID=2925408 RepID=UPI001F57C936|nr:outer membrane beta-barrel protein [Anaeromyxobacter sp. SG63]
MKNLVLVAALVLVSPIAAVAQASAAPQESGNMSGPDGRAQKIAGAETVGNGSYVAARVGAIIPKADDLDGFDTGFAFEGVIGRRIIPNVALEASVGYFAIGASASAGGTSASMDISAFNMAATIKLIAPVDKVDLYVLAGAGAYFISSKVEASGYYSGSASDDDTSLGVTLGGGLAARLSPRVSLGAEAKYLIGDTTLFGISGSYNSILLGGMLNLHF